MSGAAGYLGCVSDLAGARFAAAVADVPLVMGCGAGYGSATVKARGVDGYVAVTGGSCGIAFSRPFGLAQGQAVYSCGLVEVADSLILAWAVVGALVVVRSARSFFIRGGL